MPRIVRVGLDHPSRVVIAPLRDERLHVLFGHLRHFFDSHALRRQPFFRHRLWFNLRRDCHGGPLVWMRDEGHRRCCRRSPATISRPHLTSKLKSDASHAAPETCGKGQPQAQANFGLGWGRRTRRALVVVVGFVNILDRSVQFILVTSNGKTERVRS